MSDELNTLNIKLFPIYPAPPSVKAWHVPLFTVRYETFIDENWDLTMQKVSYFLPVSGPDSSLLKVSLIMPLEKSDGYICIQIVPYINGVNSVRIISILADVELSLTYRAIKHLLYYGCIFLLDIFSFSAIYAPTAQFSSTIACDEGMQRECARYVNMRFAPGPITMAPSSAGAPGTSSSRSDMTGNPPGGHRYDGDDIWPLVGNGASEPGGKRKVVDGVGIVELYASLRQGQSVKQWYAQHSQELANIDVRRFITFGIIKGFLYRVHKYAYATGLPAPSSAGPNTAPTSTAASSVKGGEPSSIVSGQDTATSRPNSGHLGGSGGDDHHPEDQGATATSFHSSTARSGDNDEEEEEEDDDDGYGISNATLAKYLDGTHCFDQICTELEISERELMARLKKYPYEVQIIHR